VTNWGESCQAAKAAGYVAKMGSMTLDQILPILRSTPGVLQQLLGSLPESMWQVRESAEGWSPFNVLMHLSHGEVDDWMPRVRILLSEGTSRAFDPFDPEGGRVRFSHYDPKALLAEFVRLRSDSLRQLESHQFQPADLLREGMHPELGKVTLGELLACWATHDLSHTHQITRILTRHYGRSAGPWKAYISLLRDSA
jgi:hypothetical protein